MLAPDYLQLKINSLTAKEIVMPRMVAETVLAHVCGVERKDVDIYGELNDDEIMRSENLISRVLNGEPFEYVIGKLEFYGNQIMLSRAAHIPSPETELMLDFAIAQLKKRGIDKGVAIDVCSGTGCIGLGLKREMEGFDVYLSDIDSTCVELAKDNANKLELEVKVLQGDFLDPAKAIGVDLLFCNPPYISEEEYFELDPSVKDYEPKLALVAKDNGLFFYKRLANELSACLNKGALAFIEIGYNQGSAVKTLFEKSDLEVISLEKDLAGHDRFFFLQNPN
ncbi:MAG: peptide chain release factor N(5)-glutamine methyltransferase [Rhabdochlamydiaceae bacterium]|nr:peptide chain release factor N(5)-glutamine methyltransferase [Candidatus Amphrikana amoebophyrae]